MIINTGNNGRLGNQFIRNLAVSLISKKHNLKVEYYNKDLFQKLGIEFFSGDNLYENVQTLNDTNYFTIYNAESINYNLHPCDAYFQTKDISNFIYDYLHTEKIKSNIIEKNPFKHLYNANNDLFVHVRLTDAAHFNPGINYYLNTIQTIQFNNMYISTDDPHHEIVQTIIAKYPNAKIFHCDEITAFQFGSTCKNIVLSGGTFSVVIGYIAYFSNVYYPEYHKIWHGDVFSIKGWFKMSVL